MWNLKEQIQRTEVLGRNGWRWSKGTTSNYKINSSDFKQSNPCYGCDWAFFLCIYCCCCSVSQLCLTPCDPTDSCGMPHFPVLHNLLKFAQTHISILCFLSCEFLIRFLCLFSQLILFFLLMSRNSLHIYDPNFLGSVG